jgi:hypothetical protein
MAEIQTVRLRCSLAFRSLPTSTSAGEECNDRLVASEEPLLNQIYKPASITIRTKNRMASRRITFFLRLWRDDWRLPLRWLW